VAGLIVCSVALGQTAGVPDSALPIGGSPVAAGLLVGRTDGLVGARRFV